MKTGIMTYRGKIFDYRHLSSGDICIEDIAHHLACSCRYTGATRVPYSIAEHSVRTSYLVGPHPLIALLHDSAEAYIGDIPTPQKRGLGWMEEGEFMPYRGVENQILRVIGESLGVPQLNISVKHESVKAADLTMLATEVRDLMPEGAAAHPEWSAWLLDIEPHAQIIKPWPWNVAKAEFLARFKELTHG